MFSIDHKLLPRLLLYTGSSSAFLQETRNSYHAYSLSCHVRVVENEKRKSLTSCKQQHGHPIVIHRIYNSRRSSTTFESYHEARAAFTSIIFNDIRAAALQLYHASGVDLVQLQATSALYRKHFVPRIYTTFHAMIVTCARRQTKN
jgi:hypothetical protein